MKTTFEIGCEFVKAMAEDIKITDLLLRPEFAPKVLDGRKTNTRRIIKPQPPETHQFDSIGLDFDDRYSAQFVPKARIQNSENNYTIIEPCPYGQPGDLLRFLTRWAVHRKYDSRKPLELPKSYRGSLARWTAFDGPKPHGFGKSRPGRFMPLWMRARLPLFELTAVRVERCQEISAKDILAEGVVERAHTGQFGKQPVSVLDGCAYWDLGSLWAASWARVNGKESWKANPWVWALTFRLATERGEG